MHHRTALACAALACCFAATPARAAPQFVNGLAIDANTLDASGGTLVNDGRLGFFSDIYYDAQRNEWWALSDRGPGGGTLRYETRVHQFKLDIDPASGAISNFQVLRTVIFRKGGTALDGFAPEEAGALDLAFDPEGIVVHPLTGHLLVSDEYGPSLLEINRAGRVVRRYETPANLVPRNANSGVANFASDVGNSAGKRTNRGFEGLAISPDGRTAYAMLQSAMLDEGGGSGTLNRIVAFDTRTARVKAQYAYRMEGSSQGRGISALVALNDSEFLVLERNNRGLGVPNADLASPNKKVYRIDLAGASDVSDINLSTAAAGSFTPVTKTATPWLDLAAANTLTHPSLAALGGVSPEKWEGLTVGPRLADGSYLVLAGTDNDYSVTQSGSGEQFDVWYDFTLADPSAGSIQCPIGATNGCFFTTGGGAATLSASFALLPGVLHAYAVGIDGFVAPVSTPGTAALALLGLASLRVRRRR